jgi:hypothetical protein
LLWCQAQRLYDLLEGTLSCLLPSHPAWISKMCTTLPFRHLVLAELGNGVMPLLTSGHVSALSILHAYRVVFNRGVGGGCCYLLRRAGNSKQLLQPSLNLSPFFIRLLVERRRRSLIDANSSSDMGEGLPYSDLHRGELRQDFG